MDSVGCCGDAFRINCRLIEGDEGETKSEEGVREICGWDETGRRCEKRDEESSGSEVMVRDNEFREKCVWFFEKELNNKWKEERVDAKVSLRKESSKHL